jgi:sodium-coupled neutral amino acid transporter 9
VLPSFAFNLIILVLSVLTAVFNIDPAIIISFNGAVCGFFIVYIAPIGIHLKMLYGDKETLTSSILEGAVHSEVDDPRAPLEAVTPKKVSEAVEQRQQDRDSMPKWLRIAGFSILVGYGVFVLCLQFVQIIDEIRTKTSK